MVAYQGRAYEQNLYLRDSGGAVVTGLTYADVTVRYRVPGTTSLQAKTLTVQNFVEVGLGLYLLKWDVGDLTVLGEVPVIVTAATIAPTLAAIDVQPVPLPLTAKPDTCVISGNIVDISGAAAPGQIVRFRKVGGLQYAGSSFLANDLYDAPTDFAGDFDVALARGAVVIVEIPAISVKHQITVPDQETASLSDLLPEPTT